MKALLNGLRLTLILFIALLLGASLGCAGGGTTSGNPSVTLEFQTFAGLSQKVSVLAVSNLTMCFKRLRFKADGEGTNPDPTADSDNVDFEIGEVAVDPLGTFLGSIQVPKGTYSRIEFDLEKNCEFGSSGSSVQLQNGNGTFSTQDRITIKFEGTLVVNGDSSVPLNIQALIDQLDTVTNDNEIKDKAEDATATGSF